MEIITSTETMDKSIRDEKGKFVKGNTSLTKGKTKYNCEQLRKAGESIHEVKNTKEWKETKGLLLSKKMENNTLWDNPKSKATQFKKGFIPKNKINLDENLIIEEFTKNNKNAKELAKQLNISSTTILERLRKNNIPTSIRKPLSEEKRQRCINNLGKYAKRGIIHNSKYPKKKYYEKEVRKCLCGCNDDVIGWNSRTNTPILYCPGHNPMTEKTKKILEEKIYSKNRNKTWEEKFGEKRAKELKKENSIRMSKPFEERFGVEKAKEVSKKMSASFQGIPLEKWEKFISYEPYGLEFNKKLKKAIRERDGCCLLCNIGFDDLKLLKRRTHIHHINYDKNCNLQQNLISLCASCHAKTKTNRSSWTKFFQSLLSERYVYQYSENGDIILKLENKNA